MYGSRLRVKRFEDRVLAYESVPVETGKILFYGDSLFTRCSFITKAGADNPRLVDEVRMKDGSQACINHGFGTSSADDLLYYYDRLVFGTYCYFFFPVSFLLDYYSLFLSFPSMC